MRIDKNGVKCDGNGNAVDSFLCDLTVPEKLCKNEINFNICLIQLIKNFTA
jgi:hypothetical protein